MTRPARCAALVAVLVFAVPAAATVKTDGSKPMSIGIYNALTTVPVATLDAVGAKNVSGPAQFGVARLDGPPLTRGGKPVFLTANLAWCPHCAANSWAIAIALERFGRFAKLRTIDTGTYYHDRYGGPKALNHTKGISFMRSGYTSDYLVFDSVIVDDLKGRKFQRLTAAQKQALEFAGGSFPATNIGGVYATAGSGFDPIYLRGAKLTHQQVANALHRPSSAIAKRVDGLANFFTAAICKATNGQPAEVCESPGAQAGAAKLPT